MSILLTLTYTCTYTSFSYNYDKANFSINHTYRNTYKYLPFSL